ncbi:MAG: hypothetical protein MJ210_01345 [Alphaproteobacteria bacterium]|nr:hypothetical protein [Alphaproteobacteria bacterium]
MKNKYFNATGEISFRLWMFSTAVEALQATPNEEKATNLKGKMIAFSSVIQQNGTEENLKDIEELINSI